MKTPNICCCCLFFKREIVHLTDFSPIFFASFSHPTNEKTVEKSKKKHPRWMHDTRLSESSHFKNEIGKLKSTAHTKNKTNKKTAATQNKPLLWDSNAFSARDCACVYVCAAARNVVRMRGIARKCTIHRTNVVIPRHTKNSQKKHKFYSSVKTTRKSRTRDRQR